MGNKAIKAAVSEADLDALLDPTSYIGNAPTLTDHCPCGSESGRS